MNFDEISNFLANTRERGGKWNTKKCENEFHEAFLNYLQIIGKKIFFQHQNREEIERKEGKTHRLLNRFEILCKKLPLAASLPLAAPELLLRVRVCPKSKEN